MRMMIVALLLLIGSGCARKVNVSGTVTRDGQALEWESENSELMVTFAVADSPHVADVYKATAERSGNFSFSGIPTGTYLVAVRQNDPIPTGDLLNNSYDLSNSPLRAEVKEDGQSIAIELPKELPSGNRPKRPEPVE